MNLNNQVFYNYLDKLIVVFIDDILMYSKSQKKHKQYLKFTL